jgi:hypothetical protein
MNRRITSSVISFSYPWLQSQSMSQWFLTGACTWHPNWPISFLLFQLYHQVCYTIVLYKMMGSCRMISVIFHFILQEHTHKVKHFRRLVKYRKYDWHQKPNKETSQAEITSFILRFMVTRHRLIIEIQLKIIVFWSCWLNVKWLWHVFNDNKASRFLNVY